MRVVTYSRVNSLTKPKPGIVLKDIILDDYSMIKIVYVDEVAHTENVFKMSFQFAEENKLINLELLSKLLSK